jgi:hypothetical protein
LIREKDIEGEDLMYIEEICYFEKGDNVFIEDFHGDDDKRGIVIEGQGFNEYKSVKVRLETGEEVMVQPRYIYLDD